MGNLLDDFLSKSPDLTVTTKTGNGNTTTTIDTDDNDRKTILTIFEGIAKIIKVLVTKK